MINLAGKNIVRVPLCRNRSNPLLALSHWFGYKFKIQRAMRAAQIGWVQLLTPRLASTYPSSFDFDASYDPNFVFRQGDRQSICGLGKLQSLSPQQRDGFDLNCPRAK
jgi:hypothetical protein